MRAGCSVTMGGRGLFQSLYRKYYRKYVYPKVITQNVEAIILPAGSQVI